MYKVEKAMHLGGRMDTHASDFFSEYSEENPGGQFHSCRSLHEKELTVWEEICALCPGLPRGWYELSQLSPEDRVEFIRAYWLDRLPFQPHTHDLLRDFFDRVDDVGVFLTQKKFDGPWEGHMVYSLRENGGFFHGLPPVNEDVFMEMQGHYSEVLFPEDFRSFVSIHDGFAKYSDTGIIRVAHLREAFVQFQSFLELHSPLLAPSGESVNPLSLIPFYESFGLNGYQCFWSDWYPEQEMGNIYYSGIEKTMSDIRYRDDWAENLAFPTFVDWLVFYLEGIE